MDAICLVLNWSAIGVYRTSTNVLWRNLVALSAVMTVPVIAFGVRGVGASVVAFLTLFASVGIGWLKRLPSSMRIMIVGGVIVTAISLAVVIASVGLNESLALVGRNATLTGRTQLWELAFDAFHKKTLLGWGFDNNFSVIQFYMGAMPYGQFHNGFIDLLVRGGIVGELLLVFLLVRMIRVLWRQRKINSEHAEMGIVLYLGVLVQNISEAHYFSTDSPLWIMLMVVWISAEIDVMRARSARKRTVPHQVARREPVSRPA
jgi:O-antigen ligase